MKDKNVVLDVQEVPKISKWILFSIQHLFAMFGSTILVPYLTDLSTAVALVSSGLGTLAYIIITKGQIPAYLGSSFAFITPITSAMALGGTGGVMMGSFLAGIVYGILSLLIAAFGTDWVIKVLPPVVVGPVIIVIGLGLAPTAVDMAMNVDGEYSAVHFSAAAVTLLITILASLLFKGIFGIIPILIGIIGGYTYSLVITAITGVTVLDTSGVRAAWTQIISSNSIGEFFHSLFLVPNFVIPFVDYQPFEVLNLSVVLLMVPIAVVTVAEHIGDQMVLSKVVGKNFIKKPGLHRSIMGDGVATMIASFLGGPPNTTYGENIGVLAITRVFSVFVIGGAAFLAILFGFIGIITEIISSIPTPVMGGVSILLFGIIASSGLRMLIDNQVDLGIKRNLVISSVILVIGIGGAYVNIPIGNGQVVTIAGMALSAFIGLILNLVLPGKETGYGNGSMFSSPEDDQ
ncbi:NCS2 family nucleobase:cation symporter [Gracilibacillus caseinilyticus]|uniref:NCS2 family nucleobase:cation symporter n=1 Tax=Gracilibacillus caseinilyticus TaxID=2932256 RepID=A0ABY4EWB5_9BACI|nr:solute carrier family 23 protein [Gracilibacillus caseinilyticus]UOQ47939.1 NCS2 family nucleobase:cation symporter [Gracilibacillus caseinilyticus]